MGLLTQNTRVTGFVLSTVAISAASTRTRGCVADRLDLGASTDASYTAYRRLELPDLPMTGRQPARRQKRHTRKMAGGTGK